MKRKLRRKEKWVICATLIYVTVALFIVLWGFFGLQPGDEMGYMILHYYLVLPFVAFGTSGVWGAANLKLKWIVPILTGTVAVLGPAVIFENLLIEMFLFGLVPSAVGIVAGHAVLLMKRKLART